MQANSRDANHAIQSISLHYMPVNVETLNIATEEQTRVTMDSEDDNGRRIYNWRVPVQLTCIYVKKNSPV